MRRDDVVVRGVARPLLDASVLVAAGLVVQGYAEVGDGFSAGMIVALAIALHYVGLGARRTEQALPLLRRAPALAIAGLALALGTGFFPVVLGQPPLSHRPAPGAPVVTFGSLELATPILFDLGIFLLVVGLLTTLLHLLAGRIDESGPDGGPR